MFYWTAHYLMLLLSGIFFPLQVKGRRNLPAKDSFIFASNHVSNLDPIILGLASGRRLSYMAKDSLFTNQFARWVLTRVGAFPLRRQGADVGALREALRRLQAGIPLVVFPTGTRAASFSQENAKSGIGFLAVKSHSRVVPAKILGSDRVMPSGTARLNRYPVTVVIGEPLQFAGTEDYEKIARTIIAAIEELKP